MDLIVLKNMLLITLKNANIIFNVGCLALTIMMVYYCCYRYYENDDVSEISFKRFNEDESSPYPALTFCLHEPFLEDKLKALGNGINSSTYMQYLKGELWDDRMVDVDYENVTINLENFLLQACVLDSYLHCVEEMDVSVMNTVQGKCFSFIQKYPKRIKELSVYINNSIFPNGIRPSMEFKFVVFISYPQQVVRRQGYLKKDWAVRVNRLDNYEMQFGIRDVEVIRRRNKRGSKCQGNWKNYDVNVLEKMLNNVGCRPFYSTSMKEYPPCSTSREMEINYYTFALTMMESEIVEKLTPPCSEIQRLPAKYMELELKESSPFEIDTGNGWFHISAVFESDMFKEIKQVRDYDVEELIGNAGGYVGLIIGGYCMADLPGFLLFMYNYLKKKLSRTNGATRESRENKVDVKETENTPDSLEMRLNNLEAFCSSLETNFNKQQIVLDQIINEQKGLQKQ